MTARLSDEEREQVRRMAYAGSYSREKADRNVATIERILAARLAEAEQRGRDAVLADVESLRAAIEELLDASVRAGRGGTWVHDAYLVALLAEHPESAEVAGA